MAAVGAVRHAHLIRAHGECTHASLLACVSERRHGTLSCMHGDQHLHTISILTASTARTTACPGTGVSMSVYDSAITSDVRVLNVAEEDGRR